MPDKAELAKHYRVRSGDVRMIAEGIFDPEERSKLIEVADEYDQLARGIDKINATDEADWYLKRATKMRVMSETTKDKECRNILLKVAEDYEGMANACSARTNSN